MRSTSREIVFKYIFSKLFNSDSEGLFVALFSASDCSSSDKEFAEALLSAVENGSSSYDDAIATLSQNFKPDRIFKTDICAIKIGMAELDNFKDTPVPVVIDEAVKLSAKFSTDKSPDFVNGILAAYAREISK